VPDPAALLVGGDERRHVERAVLCGLLDVLDGVGELAGVVGVPAEDLDAAEPAPAYPRVQERRGFLAAVGQHEQLAESLVRSHPGQQGVQGRLLVDARERPERRRVDRAGRLLGQQRLGRDGGARGLGLVVAGQRVREGDGRSDRRDHGQGRDAEAPGSSVTCRFGGHAASA